MLLRDSRKLGPFLCDRLHGLWGRRLRGFRGALPLSLCWGHGDGYWATRPSLLRVAVEVDAPRHVGKFCHSNRLLQRGNGKLQPCVTSGPIPRALRSSGQERRSLSNMQATGDLSWTELPHQAGRWKSIVARPAIGDPQPYYTLDKDNLRLP